MKLKPVITTDTIEPWMSNPKVADDILKHVADGGTLLEWARAYGVSYTVLAGWIAVDKDRAAGYKLALKMRDEYLTEMVIRNLRMYADFDPAEMYDADGRLLAVKDMPERIRRALSGIEIEEGLNGEVTKRIKWIDPGRALELLGRYRKLFTDKVEHLGSVSIEIVDYDPENRPKRVPE